MTPLRITLIVFGVATLAWLIFPTTAPSTTFRTITGEQVSGRLIREEKICLTETVTRCTDERIVQQVAFKDGTTQIFIEGANPKRIQEHTGTLSSPLQ